MCKIVANNLVKDDTITVEISGSNLNTLEQICYNILRLIQRDVPTFSRRNVEINTFLLCNKSLLFASIESMQRHIKRAIDKHIKAGTLHNSKPKRIKFTRAQMAAYYLFNWHNANGFNKETNAIFLPLVVFWTEQQQPIKQVELEHYTETIELL